MLEGFYGGASLVVEQNFDEVRSLAHLLCRGNVRSQVGNNLQVLEPMELTNEWSELHFSYCRRGACILSLPFPCIARWSLSRA